MPVNNNIDNIGSDIINFSLKGVDDKYYTLSDFIEKEIIICLLYTSDAADE